MNADNQNFIDAYTTLQKNAQILEENDMLDVDALLDVVNESVAAYKICQARITATEKALNEALIAADAPMQH